MVGMMSSPIVSPYDRRIVYVGRFDHRSVVGPRGAWPGVGAKVRVQGDGVYVTIDDSGPDWLQVEVDGRPTRAVQLEPGVQTIEVRSEKHGTHTFGFFKRTEASVGATQFLQFEPIQGKIVQAPRTRRVLQIIGDSISCGYGNEGTDPHESFRPATENAYMSYGAIAGRAMDADVEIIAGSGRKIWPDNTISSIYDLTVPTDSTSTYDFRGFAPEAIVINLGNSDFSKGNPDEAEWIGAYKGFIARLRNRFPKAMIYPAIGGGMLTDGSSPDRPLSTIRAYLTRLVDSLRAAGDKRIRLIEFDAQQDADGTGADWHPNVKTHEKMAAKLEFEIKKDLRW